MLIRNIHGVLLVALALRLFELSGQTSDKMEGTVENYMSKSVSFQNMLNVRRLPHLTVTWLELVIQIDDNGIRMDSEKEDSVHNWKVPTNRDLLRGVLVLSALTGETVLFRTRDTL
jgi:hypothetical protein